MSVTAGILVAVSAQFATSAFNHKQSSKQMKKLQALQQEYEGALQTDGFERAWDKYNQLCALQKEVEKELHQRRIDNIEQSFNRYLDITAYSQALKNWPLRVLPFVIKDESLFSNGSVDTNNKIALHCLLTRGNDDNFNKAVFRELEVRLSKHFNLFWGAASSHLILFYSGAWKELHDAGAVVDNLYNQLEQLPTIVISPWIDENNEFYFKVSVWGIPNVEMRNTIYKPEGITFQFKQKQAEYTKEDIQQILSELNPALTAFIGYIADQYYWRYSNIAPLLPKLIEAEMVALPANISVDFKQQYIDLLENYISDADSMILHPELSLGLCESLDDETNKKDYLQKVFITYCHRYNKDISSMTEALQLECFTKIDLSFLKEFLGVYNFDNEYREEIAILTRKLTFQAKCSNLEVRRLPLKSTQIEYIEKFVPKLNIIDVFLWIQKFCFTNSIIGASFYMEIYKKNNIKYLTCSIVDSFLNVIYHSENASKRIRFDKLTPLKAMNLFRNNKYLQSVDNIENIIKYINK